MLGKIYCCPTGRDTVSQARVVSCYYSGRSITARQADRTEACGFRPAAEDLGWVGDIFSCLFQLVCIRDVGNSLLCLIDLVSWHPLLVLQLQKRRHLIQQVTILPGFDIITQRRFVTVKNDTVWSGCLCLLSCNIIERGCVLGCWIQKKTSPH